MDSREAAHTRGRGVFISFEGGEGAGKSTQIAALADRLEQEGAERPLCVREPGGLSGAEAVRALLLHGEAHAWTPMSQTLLLYAARADLWTKVIAPALEAGRWVLADRFSDSTLAYQGAAGGLDLERIRALHDIALPGAHPDLTLWLDLDPAVGLARAAGRGQGADAFEARALDFHTSVRAGFAAVAAQEPQRVKHIDAAQSPEVVSAAVWAHVAPLVAREAEARHG